MHRVDTLLMVITFGTMIVHEVFLGVPSFKFFMAFMIYCTIRIVLNTLAELKNE